MKTLGSQELVFRRLAMSSLRLENFPSSGFRSEIVSLSLTNALIRTNILTATDLHAWLDEFRKLSGTSWIYRDGLGSPKKYVLSRTYLCQHSDYRKKKSASDESGKNTGCKAKMRVKIQKLTPKTKRNKYVKEGLMCEISIDANHNHPIAAADALRFVRPTKELEETFADYFACGMRPAEALDQHKSLLKKQLPANEVEPALANGAVCPKFNSVKYWWEKCLQKTYKSDIPKLLKERKEEYEAMGCSIGLSEDFETIAIQTPIMKRVCVMPSSCDISMIDSSSSMDCQNHAVTFALVSSPIGARPVGVIITKSLSQAAYTKKGFELFKSLLSEDAFGGRGPDLGPSIFMTDNDKAEKNALNSVWPEVVQMLCIFHVLQALWKWLWNADNRVSKDDRKTLMLEFREVLFARRVDEAQVKMAAAKQSPTAAKYENYVKFLKEKEKTIEQWCLAYRGSEMRGINTNNPSELNVRLCKDYVCQRTKAFNEVALIDFLCIRFEEYYENRLLDFAHNKVPDFRLTIAKTEKAAASFDLESIITHADGTYSVPSASEAGVYYDVILEAGCCSCPVGHEGKFCKHQCAVAKLKAIPSSHAPSNDAKFRHYITTIAKGDKAQSFEFYAPLRPENQKPTAAAQPVPSIPIQQGESEESPDNSQEDVSHSVANIWDVMREKFSVLVEGNPEFKRLNEQAVKRLERCTTENALMSYLAMMGSKNIIPLRSRMGVKIQPQPTSVARRKRVILAGERTNANCPKPKKAKRPRNAGACIAANLPMGRVVVARGTLYA